MAPPLSRRKVPSRIAHLSNHPSSNVVKSGRYAKLSGCAPFAEGFLAFPHGKQDDQVGNAVEFLAAVDIVNLLMSVGRAKR